MERDCFAKYMGLWLIEPVRGKMLAAGIQSGAVRPTAMSDRQAEGESGGIMRIQDGIATIRLQDLLMKGWSKFGGTSTVAARRALRLAGESDDVNGVLLVVDSPGGTVDGTADLADDVAALSARKPVFGYGEDLAASAAYWVLSQATEVWSNRTGQIGSIGVVAVVEDSSRAMEMEGVKVHVVASGAYKGAFTPGAPVLPEHLDDLRQSVMLIHDFFVRAVAAGRQRTPGQISESADGRVYIAEEAKARGLIDAIGSFDDTWTALRARIESGRPVRRLRAERDLRLAAARKI